MSKTRRNFCFGLCLFFVIAGLTSCEKKKAQPNSDSSNGNEFIPGGDNKFIPGGDNKFIPGGDKFIPGGGMSWDQLGDAIPGNTRVNSITLDKNGAIYIGTGFGQGVNTPGYVYKYSNDKKQWVQIGPSPDVIVNTVRVDTSGNVFAGTGIGFGGYVYELASGSNEWKILGGKNPSTCPKVFNYPPICPVTALEIGVDKEIYVSMEAGYGWTFKIAQGPDQSWVPVVGDGHSPNGPVWAMTLDSHNTLYIGTSNGGVYKVTNGSQNWQQLGGGAIPPDSTKYRYVTALAVDSKGNVYAGSVFGNVFAILNGEQKWQQPGGVIPDPSQPRVNALVFDAQDNLYAATGDIGLGHVYKLNNGAKQWVDLGASPDNTPVNTMTIDSQNHLYVGTNAAKVYKISE